MFSLYYWHSYLNGNGAVASLNRGGAQMQVKEEVIQKSGIGDTNVARMCLS